MKNLFEGFRQFNYTVLRRKIFRREAESSFYSNRKFNLPKIKSASADNIKQLTEAYPFRAYTAADRAEFISELIKIEERKDILRKADEIIAGKINLNIFEADVKAGIKWNTDYVSGYEFPDKLVWQYDYLKAPQGVDIKNAWEMGRMHYLMDLGKGYLLSDESKYAEKYKEIVKDFIIKNRFCTGVNWVSSKDVSVRLLNLLYSFGLIAESADPEFYNSFTELVLYHSIFIENNLEYSVKRGSAYVMNLTSLAGTGLLFKEADYGKKLLFFTRPKLEEEIRRQTYQDGVSFEQAPEYHCILLEGMYLSGQIFDKAEMPFSQRYKERLKKMFEVHSAIVRDDGNMPQVGDAVSSRVVNFNLKMKDFRYPAAIGGMIFEDGTMKRHIPAGSAELLLLYGLEGLKMYKNIKTEVPDNRSRGFEKGGQFVLTGKNLNIFIKGGEIGRKGGGAPGHNDTFTFDLIYKGKPLIVDPGTYSYYKDAGIRNRMRSVKYHNSPYIDNEFLSEPEGLFEIKEDLTKPKIVQTEFNNMEDYLVLEHYAYTRLADPVICKRTFEHKKENGLFIVKDEFLGGAEHRITANLHLHPEADIQQLSPREFRIRRDDAEIIIKLKSESEIFIVRLQGYDYSPGYGKLEKGRRININIDEKFPAYLETEIRMIR